VADWKPLRAVYLNRFHKYDHKEPLGEFSAVLAAIALMVTLTKFCCQLYSSFLDKFTPLKLQVSKFLITSYNLSL